MPREVTDTDMLVMAVRKKGMAGVWLPPKDFAKQSRIAKSMLKETPLKRILNAVQWGTSIWPFTNGPWDCFDLQRHLPKAMASAAEMQHGDTPNAQDLLARQAAWLEENE